jgi:hypothetical protein
LCHSLIRDTESGHNLYGGDVYVCTVPLDPFFGFLWVG